jgi:hypothetical protein
VDSLLKQRHFPFFPEHWKGESALRICSLAAQGLWINMLCEMHSGQPYGHLTTSTGVPISGAAELALVIGRHEPEVRKLLAELERAQVFSRTDSGLIYSRRMVRDEKGRGEWAERQGRRRRISAPDVTRESREDHADVTDESRECHASVTRMSREYHANVTRMSRDKGKGKGNGKREKPVKANASTGKEPVEPGPAFGPDLEPDVVAFLAMCSGHLTRGMSAGGERSRRLDIAVLVERFGVPAVSYGLREATEREKPSVEYARACAKSFAECRGLESAKPSQGAHEQSIDGATADDFPLFEDLVAAGEIK